MKIQAKNFIAAALLCMLLACLALLGVGRTPSRAQEGDGAKLVLPSSYEEYLNLEAPADAAFSEDHIAVADGGTLYVYDRAEKTYTSVSLSASAGNTVAKLGFAGERLFVAATGVSNSFYEYSFTEKQLKSFSFNCSTFLVEGDALYTATVSNAKTTIASYKISALQNGTSAQAETLGTLDTNATPSLAYSGNLYCIVDGQVYYPDSTGKFGSGSFYLSSEDPALVNGVKSVCAHGGKLLYTAQGGLYASDLSTHTSRLLLAGEGFGALASYGETLYAVCGTSVRAISVSGDTAAFTGYEIASASSSLNRLRGAVDTARAGDLLVTADAGNGRVSVFDLKTGACSEALPPAGAEGLSFRYVATDGTLIAAATEKTVFTCTYTGGEMRLAAAETVGEGVIHGIACVYGSVYYVTGNAYGKAGGGSSFHESYGSPAALTSDVYGDLFVTYDNRSVVRFTESEFLTEDGGERLNFTLPEGYASLRSDFEGNLYCLAGDKLLKNGEPLLSVEAASSLVYKGADMPCAFALGYEDSEIYLLYGDFIVKTAAEGIPTLDAIDAGGVFGDVFKPHEKEGLLIDIPQDTIGVRVDLEELKESDPENFPYLAYYRTAEEMRGVLLATKDGYALVVLYEVETASRTFTAALFRLETVVPVPTEEYFHEETGARYLSSAVSSYYYPCLHPALAGERLERGTRVDVLGTLSMPERDYALVSTGDDFGYVPAAYLTDVRPIPEDTGVYEPAWLKENKEGVKFTAEDGEELVVYERTRVDLTKREDGTYTARLTKDGKVYRAAVSEKMVDRGESDALRISLIVILSVLAVGICGCYAWYYPRKQPLDEMPKNK